MTGIDDDYPTTLEEAARAELVQLWSDLELAVHDALRGCWSVQCENIAYRIVALSRLVGCTDWGEVAMTLVRSGVYERVHREAGLTPPQIDWERLAVAEARLAETSAR